MTKQEKENWIKIAKANLKLSSMHEFMTYLNADEDDDVLAGYIWGETEMYELEKYHTER